jgi:hypothetical protein
MNDKRDAPEAEGEECGSTKAIAEEEWRSHKASSEGIRLKRINIDKP